MTKFVKVTVKWTGWLALAVLMAAASAVVLAALALETACMLAACCLDESEADKAEEKEDADERVHVRGLAAKN